MPRVHVSVRQHRVFPPRTGRCVGWGLKTVGIGRVEQDRGGRREGDGGDGAGKKIGFLASRHPASPLPPSPLRSGLVVVHSDLLPHLLRGALLTWLAALPTESEQ